MTAAGLLAGCGASHHRRAAEPAVAPAPTQRPAGNSVRVGTRPEGIVADARTGLVAVAVRSPAQIVLLDACTGQVRRRVSIPGAPRHLQLARAGGPVLVAEEPVDSLLELPLALADRRSATRIRSIAVGDHPHDAAAADGRVFVADEHGRSVSVISGNRVIDRITGFAQPGGVAAVGGDVAVVDVGADTVTLVDARTLRVVGRLAAGAGPTHVAPGPGDRVYVLDTRGDAVLTYATRPRLRLLGRVAVPGHPYGVAVDPARARLWVTETAADRVVELTDRPAVPRVVATLPTARQPNTVAADSATGRIYVADAAAGTVEIIAPTTATFVKPSRGSGSSSCHYPTRLTTASAIRFGSVVLPNDTTRTWSLTLATSW